MKKKLYELTPEHEAQLKPWADKWTKIILNTDAMTEDDKVKFKEAMDGLYAAANLPVPKTIIHVQSPFVAIMAGVLATCLIEEQQKNKINVAMRSATEAATRAATGDATRAATWAATEAATEAATRDATWAATGAATGDATGDATRAATDLNTFYTGFLNNEDLKHIFESFEGKNFKNVLQKFSSVWDFLHLGNEWSQSTSFYSFFDDIVGLNLPIYEKWRHYKNAEIYGGARFMHRDFVIVSDRPEYIKMNAQNRPHCTTGPFKKWRDGSALYALNGTFVPAKYIEKPINAKELLAEPNNDVRMAVLRNMRGGFDDLVRALNGKFISSAPSTRGSTKPIELWEVRLPNDNENIRLLKVTWHDTLQEQETFLGVPRTPEEFQNVFGLVPTDCDNAELVRLATMGIDTSKYEIISES